MLVRYGKIVVYSPADSFVYHFFVSSNFCWSILSVFLHPSKHHKNYEDRCPTNSYQDDQWCSGD